MRIAITADPEIPVPPVTYGGIERIVEMLAVGLQSRGHEIVVFSHPESRVDCRRVSWRGASSRSFVDVIKNASILSRALRREKFDILHSFSRIAYMLPIMRSTIPKIMTYQRAVSPRSVVLGRSLSNGTLHFTAISRHMVRTTKNLVKWHIISNGVPLDRFPFSEHVSPESGPLLFLGRIEEIKGAHVAIQIAQQTGRRLVLAGNIPDGHSKYFETRIKPHLHGNRIRYVGPVDDVKKNDLIGQSAALLMPVLWEEPFGIVMAESLACGTPVIGFNRGSVPEIIDDGRTGFVCDTAAEMARAVENLSSIRRLECRIDAETRFSDSVVVNAYEALYRSITAPC